MTEERDTVREEPEYTVVGIIDDGEELNRVVSEFRNLGVGKDDLTVILKRQDPDSREPFPTGTRYVVVPDDRRGIEVPVGFSIAFVLFGLLFAITTPAIGIPVLLVFISLATILLAGAFTRVGIDPILTDIEAPREEAGTWNDEFEMGKVLVFASTSQRQLLRPLRQTLQEGGGTFFITDRRLEPRAIAQASLHRSRGSAASEYSAEPRAGADESTVNRATEA